MPTLSDFDYVLPPELIAQQPAADRAASRLLHVTPTGLEDRVFAHIEHLIEPGSVLVLNDTKVIKARLLGHKISGGKVEAFIERIVAPRRAWALLRASHTPTPGQILQFGQTPACVRATVVGRQEDFFDLEFDADVANTLEQWGHMPLPPYIKSQDPEQDFARYQTVYAATPGAVAAPTAGLHFSQTLIDTLIARGVHCVNVTLHVGAGTFQPVRVKRIEDHRMHSERYAITQEAAQTINAAKQRGAKIVSVGTTSLRALESAALAGHQAGVIEAGHGDTSLFITPGFRFQIVDRLITNFHLPQSTLLMLVSAFAGMARIRTAYEHAIKARYRFFSYGDAMLLDPQDNRQ